MQLLHCRSPEWYCANEHDIKADTCTPHICFEAPISSLFDYLWSDVCWSSALVVHALFLRFDLARNTKVTNLYST